MAPCQVVKSLLHALTTQPIGNRIGVDVNEYSLTELLHRRQPIGVETNWSAVDCKPDIF